MFDISSSGIDQLERAYSDQIFVIWHFSGSKNVYVDKQGQCRSQKMKKKSLMGKDY